MTEKIVIYQVLPRLFGNDTSLNKHNGTIHENGVGKFSAFDSKALQEIKKLGMTHIWYTGVLEHASKTDYSAEGIDKDKPAVVKGNAGSPYAIRDYYDISPDLADDVANRMQEFEELVQRTHTAGMKVIIDFVPNHVARHYYSDAKPHNVSDLGEGDDTNLPFSSNNNFYYMPTQALELRFVEQDLAETYSEYPAKATGNNHFNNCPSANDWYETVKLNYGVDYCYTQQNYFSPTPSTWLKMRDILLYWTAKGVDAFRCDMAEMVPVDFWHWVIPRIKAANKDILFIAEVYNPAEYRNYIDYGLFDYLYDKVDLYDTLRDVVCGYRPASAITFSWQRLNGIQHKMLNFLENHDEQRIASDFFAGDPLKAIPAMIVAATINTNPVMLYAGQELGEKGMCNEGFSGVDGRTTIFDYWSIDTIRRWRNKGSFGTDALSSAEIDLLTFYASLFQLCNSEASIRSGSFYDLMYANYENTEFDSCTHYVYMRALDAELILVLVNFSGEETDTNITIPTHAFESLGIDPLTIHKAYDLLSTTIYELESEKWHEEVKINLKAYSGKIIKLSAN